MTSAEPVILTPEVGENFCWYVHRLKQVCHYQPILQELMPTEVSVRESLPAQKFIDRIQKDGMLIRELGIDPEQKSQLPRVIAQHYHRIDQYFTSQRGDTLSNLDHLAYFVEDLQRIGGKVNWLREEEFDDVRGQLQEQLLPLFTAQVKRLRGEAYKILREHDPTYVEPKEPEPIVYLTPFMRATGFSSQFPVGILYAQSTASGPTAGSVISKIYLNVGIQPQVLFDDLEGGDIIVGVEPDKGYIVDTLTEEGYKGIPKQRFERILEELVKRD